MTLSPINTNAPSLTEAENSVCIGEKQSCRPVNVARGREWKTVQGDTKRRYSEEQEVFLEKVSKCLACLGSSTYGFPRVGPVSTNSYHLLSH